MKNIYILFGVLIAILGIITADFIPIDFQKVDWYGYASYVSYALMAFGLTLFGCGDQAPRSCDNCPEDELNKIVHVAFVRKGTAINTSTPALFISTLLTAELNCNAFIIRNVSGSKPKPTSKEGKGAGKQIKRILAKEHSIDVIDFNYVKNVAFWNDIEQSAANYDMYYFTDTYGWVVTNTQLSINPMDEITDDNTTFIEGSFIVSWAQKGNPLPYKANVDSLQECQELFDGSELTWINQSGTESTIIGNEVTIDINAPLAIGVDTGVTLDSVSVEDGSLPTGLTVDVDGENIEISGTPTVAGTSNLILRASNACGVSGEISVTIVVNPA
jgi:hypothetical protein